MNDFDCSIIVPIYNEEKHLPKILDSIYQIKTSNKSIKLEIVMVNDGSTDTSGEICSRFAAQNIDVKFINNKINQGKGSAVQQGISSASGNLILIQDSDMEYYPSDIPAMYYRQLSAGPLVAVYGSRILGARKYGSKLLSIIGYPKNQSIFSYVFNRILTILFYLRFRIWITDLLTGYKMYPSELFNNWKPKTSGFETDHEITIRLINRGFTIKEVPILFNPRTRSEGKKIGAKDAFLAIKTILLDS
jgi:glycosyltransferase involved in cell wall biosynthesis